MTAVAEIQAIPGCSSRWPWRPSEVDELSRNQHLGSEAT